jgi:excinuclease ABC subunit C
MKKSLLDDIPGLGENRRARLLKTFGGVTGVKNATQEDLSAVSWLPEAVARAVYEKIHGSEQENT